MIEMTPQYNTITFCDVWDSYEKFNTDWTSSPYYQRVYELDRELVYYLLVAKYGNNPIANNDVNQFKLKVFTIMFQYGPAWQTRLTIQKKLQDLTKDSNEDILLTGSMQIYNHAMNPNTVPSTDTDEQLVYINDQNVNKYKRGKLEAYGTLWELLRLDVSEEFLKKFINLFKKFVRPEEVLIYTTDIEEEA